MKQILNIIQYKTNEPEEIEEERSAWDVGITMPEDEKLKAELIKNYGNIRLQCKNPYESFDLYNVGMNENDVGK